MACEETWVVQRSEQVPSVPEEVWYEDFMITEDCDFITTEDGGRIYIEVSNG